MIKFKVCYVEMLNQVLIKKNLKMYYNSVWEEKIKKQKYKKMCHATTKHKAWWEAIKNSNKWSQLNWK